MPSGTTSTFCTMEATLQLLAWIGAVIAASIAAALVVGVLFGS